MQCVDGSSANKSYLLHRLKSDFRCSAKEPARHGKQTTATVLWFVKPLAAPALVYIYIYTHNFDSTLPPPTLLKKPPSPPQKLFFLLLSFFFSTQVTVFIFISYRRWGKKHKGVTWRDKRVKMFCWKAVRKSGVEGVDMWDCEFINVRRGCSSVVRG